MSYLLARGSGVQEEQWLHRSKVLQSVGSFNTRMRKCTSPQLSQYEVSIAARMGVVTKRMVLMAALLYLLLLHLLALLHATVVNVVVNLSVVCTIAVAVAVIVTGMYPLSTHATTVVIAMDNVDMSRRLIIYYYLFCEAGSARRNHSRTTAAVA